MGKDAYVICRIFEKSGSGPMNGAEYGAPFLEEEWEEEEADGVVLLPDSGGYVATEQEFFELSDFMQVRVLVISFSFGYFIFRCRIIT